MRYKQYLDDVCSEIRFKAAHKTLRQELTAHIDDKKEELAQNGADDAQAQAIAAMGNASETGKALDAIHKPRTEWGVLICVVLLSIAGLLVLILTNQNDVYLGNKDIAIQVLAVIMGLCFMTGLIFFNYAWLVWLRYVFYIIAIILSITSREWLTTDSYGQISMIDTISSCLFLLSFLGFVEINKKKGIAGLIRVGVICAISLISMWYVPSLLTVLLLLIVYLTVISSSIHQNHFEADRRWLYYLITYGVIVIVFLIVLLFLFASGGFERTFARLSFGANIDPTAEGYSTAIARNIIKGSQLIGPSEYYTPNQGEFHLPYSSTNYVFTAIIGAYGWLLGLGIMFVFIGMFTLMITRSQKIKHTFGKLLSTSASTFLLVKFLLNVLSNLGLFTRMANLPFISYGTFDYVISTALIGIFLSVWRRSSFMDDTA